MKKLICLCVMAVASITILSAQDYNWAVGVRFGGEMGGASVKYKFNAANGIEAIVAAPWNNGVLLTGLYQRYIPVIGRGFHFYYGFGAHVGEWYNKFTLGIDGIAGLEYKFDDIPLALSFDYRPMFNVAGWHNFQMADFALGVRITF